MEGTVNCTVYRLLTVSTRCNIIEHEVQSQGPEEMCLSLEHQKSSKTSEKMGYFDRVTVALHIL